MSEGYVKRAVEYLAIELRGIDLLAARVMYRVFQALIFFTSLLFHLF
jgi:hypothetical protein